MLESSSKITAIAERLVHEALEMLWGRDGYNFGATLGSRLGDVCHFL